MSKNSVSVFRIDYELMPNMNQWTVYIAAFSNEEAYKHLCNTVNKPLRVTSTTMVCRLDDLSKEIRQNVINAFLNAKGNSKAAKVVDKTPQEVDKTDEVKKVKK